MDNQPSARTWTEGISTSTQILPFLTPEEEETPVTTTLITSYIPGSAFISGCEDELPQDNVNVRVKEEGEDYTVLPEERKGGEIHQLQLRQKVILPPHTVQDGYKYPTTYPPPVQWYFNLTWTYLNMFYHRPAKVKETRLPCTNFNTLLVVNPYTIVGTVQ